MRLNRKELRKIIYDFNSISNRLLQADFEDYNGVLAKFIDFIQKNPIINDYILDCGMCEQSLTEEFQEVGNSYGHCIFSLGDTDEEEVRNLRNYLLAGGFLHIDDNYGMKDFVMAQIQKVFPELQWVELPYTHEIFQTPYSFPDGLPKIHEHDNKSPQALAMIYQGRMVCLFTYECDLGDGWEDQRVHHDSEETRLKALKMGANIVQYVFSN